MSMAVRNHYPLLPWPIPKQVSEDLKTAAALPSWPGIPSIFSHFLLYLMAKVLAQLNGKTEFTVSSPTEWTITGLDILMCTGPWLSRLYRGQTLIPGLNWVSVYTLPIIRPISTTNMFFTM